MIEPVDPGGEQKVSAHEVHSAKSKHESERDDTTTVLPLIAEQLTVGKQVVETGGVRIHKTIEEREETADLTLHAETVQIERIPIGKPVEGIVEMRREGNILIVPIVEEVLVVEKRLMLKEELHIRIQTDERHQPEKVVLRSEHVEIERFSN